MLFRLQSREYTNIGNECLKFWYFLNGPDASNGKLTLTQHHRGAPSETNLWSGDIYDKTWRYEQVFIDGGVDPFTVSFIASKPSPDVIVGIDDVILTLGYCPPPTTCDFESAGLCSWTQMKDDDFDWLLQSGETISSGTGPLVGKNFESDENVFFYLCLLDHTTNSVQGHYIYIESSAPAEPNYKARIISEHLVVGQGCFSLWYHMYGPDIGSLVIYTSTKANPMTEVYRITGDQGNQWIKLNADIGVTLQNKEWVRIIVEAVVGNGYLGKRTFSSLTYRFSPLFF